MWNRVHYDSWQVIFPILAFVLTAGVFVWLVVRTLRMRRREVERRANLPLEEEQSQPSSPSAEESDEAQRRP